MLSQLRKTVHVTAVSTVNITDESGKNVSVQAAYMNATMDGNGKITVGHTIKDANIYASNRDVIRADIAEFTDYVYSLENVNVDTGSEV